MTRLLRRTGAGWTGLSLGLCLAALVLWVRSYRAGDALAWGVVREPGRAYRDLTLVSGRGWLRVEDYEIHSPSVGVGRGGLFDRSPEFIPGRFARARGDPAPLVDQDGAPLATVFWNMLLTPQGVGSPAPYFGPPVDPVAGSHFDPSRGKVWRWRVAAAYAHESPRGALKNPGPYERCRGLIVPYWLAALAFSLTPAVRLVRRGAARRRRRRRLSLGLCPSCGYDLRGTPGRCPECGAFPGPAPRRPT